MAATQSATWTNDAEEVVWGVIPASLVCEQCGERPVEVIVTWLGVNDAARLCGVDYIATAVGLAMEVSGVAVPDES